MNNKELEEAFRKLKSQLCEVDVNLSRLESVVRDKEVGSHYVYMRGDGGEVIRVPLRDLFAMIMAKLGVGVLTQSNFALVDLLEENERTEED